MSGDGNTKHKITFENTGGTDPEYLLFRFFKLVPDARAYLNEDGKSTGNGYDWHNIIDDMVPFTLAFPDILVIINEKGTYGGEEFENRYYFQNGKSALIEPVVTTTWPEFTPDLLVGPKPPTILDKLKERIAASVIATDPDRLDRLG